MRGGGEGVRREGDWHLAEWLSGCGMEGIVHVVHWLRQWCIVYRVLGLILCGRVLNSTSLRVFFIALNLSQLFIL